MPTYWPEQWELIQEIQSMKQDFHGFGGIQSIHSNAYVMTNPVTGGDVPIEDLRYAKDHMYEIYNSGMIKEDRWAFLWYH
jgi:hypothetical protein